MLPLLLSALGEETSGPLMLRLLLFTQLLKCLVSSHCFFLCIMYIRACICIISILESKNRVQTFQTPREHIFTDFSSKIIIYFYRAQISLIGVGFRANTELYLGVELRAGGLGRAPASPLCGRAVQGPPSGIFSVIPFRTHFLLLSSLFCGLWGCLKRMGFVCSRYTYILPFIFIAAVFGFPFVCSACKLQFRFFSRLFVTVLRA